MIDLDCQQGAGREKKFDQYIEMMASVESVLHQSDVDRVVRFINSAPLKVSLQSGEAVSHDVERFCAFRQDAFHESEKCGEASLVHLRKAQDARLKLLDGIDKYVLDIIIAGYSS